MNTEKDLAQLFVSHFSMKDAPITAKLCQVRFVPAEIDGEAAITLYVQDLIALREQCREFEIEVTTLKDFLLRPLSKG